MAATYHRKHLKKVLTWVLVATVVCGGVVYVWEHQYVVDGVKTEGTILSFRRRGVTAPTADSYEMKIAYSVDGEKKYFFSGRSIFEQLQGTYKVGDSVPVVYNENHGPPAKIATLPHLYGLTVTFCCVGILFSGTLVFLILFKTKKETDG